MRRFVRDFLFTFAVLGVLPAAARAATAPHVQASTAATLVGTVVDASGGAIVGARVIATAPSGAAKETLTDARGAFSISLGAGSYLVSVSAPGFQTASATISVASGFPENRVFHLDIAGISTAVTATATPGYTATSTASATKTDTPLRDIPQSVTVISRQLIQDQGMLSLSDAMRYVPGVAAHQGENNRDEVIVRGVGTSSSFFVDGVRDDVQYYRDLFDLDRVEVLKGPNAMIFGRGGGGGVVNRVLKSATFTPLSAFTLGGGAYKDVRTTADVNRPLNNRLAFRLNGVYEHSSANRNNVVDLQRVGITPTLTFNAGAKTTVRFTNEYLHDTRGADRGITSYQGRPLDMDPSTFFGDPANSHVRANVNVTSLRVEHRVGSLSLRNHTAVGNYSRFYQNYVPGAVNAAGTTAVISSYSNATDRLNVFNQTDAVWSVKTGALQHRLLLGAELGRQLTDNFRNTGFFNNTVTSVTVPLNATVISTPVTFRQSATDADNHLVTTVVAGYVQDQLIISPSLQVVGGVRVDRFDLTYRNNRTRDVLTRPDTLVSPRGGVIIKPVDAVSLYASYGISYLPSSGDQFSSLTTITEQVKPERFANIEGGLKWDISKSLSLTSAVYRLDRTNTRATDPNNATRILQTGGQRTNGYEIGLNGQPMSQWSVAGGYAYQSATVTSATVAAAAGAVVAQVPHHTLSLWSLYQVQRVGVGVGVIARSRMFAGIDNTVTLPGFVRVDLGVFWNLTRSWRFQANLENMFDRRYILNADSNTNISPGSPRALRLGVTARF